MNWMQRMSPGKAEGCSECDSDTSFPRGRELNVIILPAGAPTVVVTYLIVSPCGLLGLHSLPERQANIVPHFSPPTVTCCSLDSSEAKNLLSTTFFAFSYPLVSFTYRFPPLLSNFAPYYSLFLVFFYIFGHFSSSSPHFPTEPWQLGRYFDSTAGCFADERWSDFRNRKDIYLFSKLSD